MMIYRGGGPAFPMKEEQRELISEDMEKVTPGDWPGMALRDYFAIRILNEVIAQQGAYSGDGEAGRLAQAELAYQYADSMLKARGASAPANEDITPTLEAHPVNF